MFSQLEKAPWPRGLTCAIIETGNPFAATLCKRVFRHTHLYTRNSIIDSSNSSLSLTHTVSPFRSLFLFSVNKHHQQFNYILFLIWQHHQTTTARKFTRSFLFSLFPAMGRTRLFIIFFSF